MEIAIIGLVIMPIAYILCNIYWHKKIIEGKWAYTIYSTIILVIYILSVLTTLSLV